MKVTILVDNPTSWVLPHAKKLIKQIENSHSVVLIHNQAEIELGDIAIILSCEKLIKPDILARSRYNLVAHASPLPKGKGMSPLTWQILEGQNEIVVTLFEAVEKIDAGVIYNQTVINFEGHELIDEMQEELGKQINELIINFINNHPNIIGREQIGEETTYRWRKAEDSELDINKTIAEQFNLLRVVNYEKYPAFFNYHGHKYILKVYKSE
jgi:methionyl-tRNA formyltransferase